MTYFFFLEGIKDLFPEGARYYFALEPDSPGFWLGALYFLRDPLKIITVQDGSLAAAMGLKTGDRIKLVSAIPVNYMHECQKIIERNAGKSIGASVIREGQDHALFFTVPPVLPKH